MGVPWRWCAEALIGAYFPIARYNASHPDDPKIVKVSAGIRGLPPGRPRRRRTGDRGERSLVVSAKIKHPADSIHALAEEYATRENRINDCRSVVQTGIARAEMLLNREIRS